MRVLITALVVVIAGHSATAARAAELSTKESKRIQEAAQVLKEIHAVPDKDIPEDLWSKAECVLVVPGLKKGALVVGGEYGNGLMSCRQNGRWSAPVFMQGEGERGFQIGAPVDRPCDA
jgi:lipid-binding SYLF domain-containing protein